MKIYEYAKNRNIRSRDVVKKLKEMGFNQVKNHLSLVPEKIIDELDKVTFENNKKVVKNEPKTIMMISMECSPFSSNGLGDMIKNKIKYQKLDGNKIIVVIPKYHMDTSVLEDFIDIELSILHNKEVAKVYKTSFENVDYYFIDSHYFNRDRLYGYPDDAMRFACLSKAAIEVINNLNIDIDIINIHDWSLGLFPLLFEENLRDKMKNTIIELSVYGATYQGIYGVDVLTEVYELDKKHYFDTHVVEYANSVNFLKAGLVTADKLDINKVALTDLKESYLRDFVYDNRLNTKNV